MDKGQETVMGHGEIQDSLAVQASKIRVAASDGLKICQTRE